MDNPLVAPNGEKFVDNPDEDSPSPSRSKPPGAGGAASKMPYRVRLDDTGGRSVLVHRDEHRFIRSRDLQAPGPRTGATRVLDKFVTRQKKDGSWEKVDHETLKVRACADPNADEGDY